MAEVVVECATAFSADKTPTWCARGSAPHSVTAGPNRSSTGTAEDTATAGGGSRSAANLMVSTVQQL